MKAGADRQWWAKWDDAVPAYDIMNRGLEVRFGDVKRQWFSRASGRTLLVAVGTGLDFQYLSDGLQVVGVDISENMLGKAREKLVSGVLNVKLVRADIQNLSFPANTFDTVLTSCTFCSVPDPIAGLKELFRVMKPGGGLLMFEHVRSNIAWMGPMMDLLTRLSSRFGPDLNRRTGDNIRRSGFRLTREVNVYLDMVKLFEAIKPAGS